MSSLPTGTVTFLLADLEGSTELLQNDRIDYGALIADVRRILRDALANHGGHEVDAAGDELL
ncbi:MAG: hypothetical protein ACRDPV_07150, partial [Gaiellaceae bacterium]